MRGHARVRTRACAYMCARADVCAMLTALKALKRACMCLHERARRSPERDMRKNIRKNIFFDLTGRKADGIIISRPAGMRNAYYIYNYIIIERCVL